MAFILVTQFSERMGAANCGWKAMVDLAACNNNHIGFCLTPTIC